ncbi:ShlB/FhaC/HecB family hemolysin secretion/activation protein [Carnimonas bestiolae]|uniref:ShlB/FhaC/HecB family hemolysin secretion/activation protein n=1 Tax=Carnimonas bestiolae TaxID=3402172 RepID=UPI003EDBEB21
MSASSRLVLLAPLVNLFMIAAVFHDAPATAAEPLPINQQQQHIQSQQRALQQQLTPSAPDIHDTQTAPQDADAPFPHESPCFIIRKVELSGQQAFPFWFSPQQIVDQAKGQCLGAQGINQLMRRLQNRMTEHGWITSRVLAPPQDLVQGTLKLELVPGILRLLRYANGSDTYALLSTAIPNHSGELLDLRAIEQGLENLQGLPTVKANMQIVPGDKPGESDVVIERHQTRFWRLSSWVDNTGTRSTGRTQGGAMLALDNPLRLSDLFYISASNDLAFQHGKDTRNVTLHYSVPLGYWQWDTTASRYHYVQTIAGYADDIRYSGTTQNLYTGLSRVVQRSARGKTTLSGGINFKQIKNYIDHSEVDVQKRRTTALQFGINHRHYLGSATLDTGLDYQHGVRWFGALPAYESDDVPGFRATDKTRTLTFNSAFTLPFELGEQTFSYQTNLIYQHSKRPLTPPDQLAIGNRWTVRGFDGERSLSASRGFYWQNTLAWATPLPDQELYAGADYGRVGGHSDGSTQLGHQLAGAVIGMRGALPVVNISYDAALGTPLMKPKGFKTDSVTFNFSANWQY